MRCRHTGAVANVGNMTGYRLFFRISKTWSPFTQGNPGFGLPGRCCWDELHPGPPYKSGGPLRVQRVEYDLHTNMREMPSWKPKLDQTQKVQFWPHCIFNPIGVFSGDVTRWDDAGFRTPNHFGTASSYGATGWAKARPGRPGADLAVFLGEFREVPRMLASTANFFHNSWKAAMSGVQKTSKHAADSWLAANFGWLPFVSDLRKFARTHGNIERRIQQLRRDNMRWVRRERTVKVEKVVDNPIVYGSLPYLYPNNFGSIYDIEYYRNWTRCSGSTEIRKTAESDFRFVGRFRYWIPNINSSQWEASARRRLYGGGLTPSVVWNLTPFSWLVDWYSNLGDVISNLDNDLAENLVASYAYLVGSSSINTVISMSQPNWTVPFRDTWTHRCILKERVPASPFGFALSSDSFSARQWSLLSALGLQRWKFL